MSPQQQFLNTLKNNISPNSIITDVNHKVKYETDWRGDFIASSICVIFPSSINEIQYIIKNCIKYNIKITPQGGNTSKCGAAVPNIDKDHHIILNLSKLNKILDFDAQNKSICVESGCTLMQINKYLAHTNLFFPLNITPKESCQIGGNIATNAGGMNVLKYGMMRDITLGLEVILPNGNIINQLTTLRKNNTYIDLKQIFIGSEGTLGIITKAQLKLALKPHSKITFLIGAPTLNICNEILTILQINNLSVSAFEVLNKRIQEIHQQLTKSLPITDEWLIIGSIDYFTQHEIEHLHNALNNINAIKDKIIIATSETEQEYIWSIRKNIPLIEKSYGNALKYDISLPIGNVENFINHNHKSLLLINIDATQIIIFGHLGDGNLHYNIPLSTIPNNTNHEFIHETIYSNVINHGGSISAEHGIGQLKNKWHKMFCDANSYNLTQSIKSLLDPLNIFNPGKVF